MNDERSRAQTRDRVRAFRERQRAAKGPSDTELARSTRRMHDAIERAAGQGDAWAMQVLGRNPRDTAENVCDYAKGERGRICLEPFGKL